MLIRTVNYHAMVAVVVCMYQGPGVIGFLCRCLSFYNLQRKCFAFLITCKMQRITTE